ncbi:hypothetical protein D3C84_491150 [compost metagenome]
MLLIIPLVQNKTNNLINKAIRPSIYFVVAVVILAVSQQHNFKAGHEIAQSAGFANYADYTEGEKLNLTPQELAVKKEEDAKVAKKQADEQLAADNAKDAVRKFNDLVSTVKASCRAAITSRLKDPDSAKFGDSSAEPDLNKGIWIVTREVTAKNSFNANIRSLYRCNVEINNGHPTTTKVYEVK